MAETTDPDVLKAFETPNASTGGTTDPEVLKAFGEPEQAKPQENLGVKRLKNLGLGVAESAVGGAQALYHGLRAIDPMFYASPNVETGASGLAAAADRTAKRLEAAEDPGFEMGATRFVGNLLNPLNWFGGGEALNTVRAGKAALEATSEVIGKEALKEGVKSAGKTAALGAAGGAMQPVASDDYATTKALQIGTGGVVGGAAGTASPLIAQAGRFLSRNLPENLAATATAIIKDRWDPDARWGGMTAKEALDTIQKARAAGQPLTLADVAGPDVKSLAGRVARRPGESRSMAQGTMAARDVTAKGRLEQGVRDLVSENTSAGATVDVLTAVQSAASRDAWDKLYQQKVGYLTDHFKQLLQNPRVAEGFKLGFELERDQADKEGRPISHLMTGVDLDAQGNISFVDMPNMRVLDMGKRGLDAIIQSDRNDITGKLGVRGQSAAGLKQAYLAELDKMTNGAYSRTMQVYAGPAASKDAVAWGEAIFGGKSPYEIEKEFNALSEGDKEFARVGVANAMVKKLMQAVGATQGNLGPDEAKALVKNEWVREQLRPIFKSSQKFDEFMDLITNEIRMFETKTKTVGGSATGEREAEAREPIEGAVRTAIGMFTQHPALTALGMWRYLKGVHARNDPKLDSAIAQLVFGNPDAIQAAQLTGEQAITKTNKVLPAAQVTNSIGQLVAPTLGGQTAGGMFP